MGFLLECPNCGKRDAYEFRFGGESHKRPVPDASSEAWADYSYMRENVAGVQREWWFHRLGCGKWFLAIRDTRDNSVLKTFWYGEGQ
jgi:heterotetrameric sarcosine oxidase delta subunit